MFDGGSAGYDFILLQENLTDTINRVVEPISDPAVCATSFGRGRLCVDNVTHIMVRKGGYLLSGPLKSGAGVTPADYTNLTIKSITSPDEAVALIDANHFSAVTVNDLTFTSDNGPSQTAQGGVLLIGLGDAILTSPALTVLGTVTDSRQPGVSEAGMANGLAVANTQAIPESSVGESYEMELVDQTLPSSIVDNTHVYNYNHDTGQFSGVGTLEGYNNELELVGWDLELIIGSTNLQLVRTPVCSDDLPLDGFLCELVDGGQIQWPFVPDVSDALDVLSSVIPRNPEALQASALDHGDLLEKLFQLSDQNQLVQLGQTTDWTWSFLGHRQGLAHEGDWLSNDYDSEVITATFVAQQAVDARTRMGFYISPFDQMTIEFDDYLTQGEQDAQGFSLGAFGTGEGKNWHWQAGVEFAVHRADYTRDVDILIKKSAIRRRG